MVKGKFVHGDSYYDVFMNTDPQTLTNEWWKWRAKYYQYRASKTLDTYTLCNLIQAWHVFSAITSLLIDKKFFDEDLKEPYGGNNADSI